MAAEEVFTVRHESAVGRFEGEVRGTFTGRNQARSRDQFVASLRASGWKVNEPIAAPPVPVPEKKRTRAK